MEDFKQLEITQRESCNEQEMCERKKSHEEEEVCSLVFLSIFSDIQYSITSSVIYCTVVHLNLALSVTGAEALLT